MTLAELEDGPQMYEAMYNIQSRSNQARDSGISHYILNLSATFMQTLLVDVGRFKTEFSKCPNGVKRH